MNTSAIEDDRDYASEYTEEGFWAKLRKYARVLGGPLVRMSLRLYYALDNPETPGWAKGVIYGALGYLIMPADVVPDLVPMVGYVDDMGVLAAAVATLAKYIDEEVRRRADEKWRQWFGDDSEGAPA